MGIIKKLVNTLSWVVYVAVAVFIITVIPIIFGYKPLVVLSGSMEPNYSIGSILYYKQVEFDDIQVGDAITFQMSGGTDLVTHRVTVKNEMSQTFVTKGDANEEEDSGEVAYSQVLGKVSNYNLPYLGYYVSYLKDKIVIFICASILLLNIALGFFESDGSKKENRVKESTSEQTN